MFNSFWFTIIYTLITTHITIALVTIYLHRAQAHKSLKCSRLFDYIARIWLWFFTTQITTEWVSVHRKHHAKCETQEDPHSPKIYGLKNILLKGVLLYRKEANNPDTIKRYSIGCPNDKLEKFFFNNRNLGIIILLILNLVFLSYWGLLAFAIQMIWIPFWAAGVINGVGHYWGYRNFESSDASTNISPWGIIIGGEELHNNHHAYPTSAKLSIKPWEFDIGWLYINILKFFGLVSNVKIANILKKQEDFTTFFVSNQFYYKKILNKSLSKEIKKQIKISYYKNKNLFSLNINKLSKVFLKPKQLLNELEKDNLKNLLSTSQKLSKIYSIILHLQDILENKKLSYIEIKTELIGWKNKYLDIKELSFFFYKTKMNLLLNN